MKIPKYIGIKLKVKTNKDNIEVEYEPCEVVEAEKLRRAEQHIRDYKNANKIMEIQSKNIVRNVKNNYVSKLSIERMIDELEEIKDDKTVIEIKQSDIRKIVINYLKDLLGG